MELLENFGFKPELFVAQIVNFLILFYVFKRFLYKPIQKVLKERSERIAKGLKEAEESHLLREESGKQRIEILRSTREEAQEIIKDAKNQAVEIREKVKIETEKETLKMINEAKMAAQIELESTKTKIKDMALTLAYDVLSNISEAFFTDEEKEKILKRTMNKLKSN